MNLYLFGQKYIVDEKPPGSKLQQKRFLLRLEHAAEKQFPSLHRSELLVTERGKDLWKFTFYQDIDIVINFDSIKMKAQKPRRPQTDTFVDWPIAAVETFVRHISGKNNGNQKMDSEKVYALLLILTNLKWEKNKDGVPILPPKALDVVSEAYMKHQIPQQPFNDYDKIFSGIKLKDLASYCLATGKFPQDMDLLRKNDFERE
jgi:hypothetical protein